MADNTVLRTIYATEFVKAYEQKQSIFRGCVTTEGDVKGNQFVFIIEGTADIAVERGASGRIPYASDGQSDVTLTMKQYHHLASKEKFNIESSSVPQRASMQRRGVVSVNNRTDQLIISQAITTSYTTGATGANSLAKMLDACAILDENKVPDDGERYGFLSPRAWAHAMKIDQFTSSRYIDDGKKPFMRQTMWYEWNNVKWCRHPNMSGKGTNACKCIVMHKSGIGHGLNLGEMQSFVGYNEEQDYSWARVSAYMGAKMIQSAGVVILLHDDTAAL